MEERFSNEDQADVSLIRETSKHLLNRHKADALFKVLRTMKGHWLLKICLHFTYLCHTFDIKFYAGILEVFWGAVVFFLLFSGWAYFGDFICFVDLPSLGLSASIGTYCSAMNFPVFDAANCLTTNCSLVDLLRTSCQPNYQDSTSVLPLNVLQNPRLRNLALSTALALFLLACQIIFASYTAHSTFNSANVTVFRVSWLVFALLDFASIGLLLWISSWVNSAGLPLCSVPLHLRFVVAVFVFMFIFIFCTGVVACVGSMLFLYLRTKVFVMLKSAQPKNAATLAAVGTIRGASQDDSSSL